MLEEVEVPQPLGLGHGPDAGLRSPAPQTGCRRQSRCRLSAPCARRQNQCPAHTTVWQCRGRLQTVGFASRALASIAECRTMPAFSKARLSGPEGAVKGSLRRASPALDRAHRTLLSTPDPLEFQKRQIPSRITEDCPPDTDGIQSAEPAHDALRTNHAGGRPCGMIGSKPGAI